MVCLSIFDENCPEFFAPNERDEYAEFLDSAPIGYEVCLINNAVIGAFGLVGSHPEFKHLNWILISEKLQGLGIGDAFLTRVIKCARAQKLQHIKIAASHLSAPFFAKYGAKITLEVTDGWGPNMHRIDMELYL